MLKEIKRSMKEYYQSITARNWHFPDEEREAKFYKLRAEIFKNMDDFYRENPNTHTALLKVDEDNMLLNGVMTGKGR